jgi:serine/threonine protein kinase
MIGQTISHYKILEKLGEGGMGVVYKAEDTKLDRIVALKFLPHHLTANEAEKARFLQEAKAAAALNHPNVCSVIDIQEFAGQQFIIMEYVDGSTLRQIVPVQKMEQAIKYAVQIGEALQAAHAKSIVHRDIKSDNIMVSSDGRVKVMDFGLAKLKGSLKLTKTSSTVGTLSYMAPEQLQGAEVDARSDIFSFGVVLFELLTGHIPFRGEHEAALMYSIVNEEPEPLTKYVPGASPELLHILSRALEKSPEDRYQQVAEMVIDLRRLQKQSTKVTRVMNVSQQSPVSSRSVPVEEPASVPHGMFTRNRILLGAAALLIVAAALYFRVPSLLRGPSGGSSASVALNPNMTLRVLQIPLSEVSYPGISSDGNWISFPGGDRNGKWDIYYMHTSGTDPKRITNDSMVFNQQVSDLSPDGSQVAYTHRNNGVYIVSSLGGGSRKIIEDALIVRWRPDAQRIGYEVMHAKGKRYLELWSVKPDGSDNRLDYGDSVGTEGRLSFSWSPDGKSVAWIRSFGVEHQEVFTRELETGKELQLTFDNKNVDDVCWLRNGMILFSSNKSGNTNLWAIPAAGGTAQQVTKGSGPDIGITASADAKKIIYLQQQPVGYVWTASTRNPSAQQLTFEERDIKEVCLSPDKKRIAFIMGDPDPLKQSLNIFTQDRDGTNRRQITNDAKGKGSLGWSLDGKWISYAVGAQPQESIKVTVVDPDHPGTPRALGYGFPRRWISNTSLLVVKSSNGTFHTAEMLLENGEERRLFEDSTFAFPVSSGKLIAYFDNRAGKEGLWTIPADYLQNPAHKSPKFVDKFDDAQQSSGEIDAFYFQNRQHEWWRYRYESAKRERLNVSFPGLAGDSQLFVSPDGEEAVYIVRKLSAKLVMMENLFQQ